jgi:hypothetical protein
LGNASDGVLIAGAPDNTIGGQSFPVDAGNWISSNDSDGVAITGPGATGNKVGANRIPGNSGHGVRVEGASDNTIGGDNGATLAGNIIVGNGGDGVFVASGTGNSILASGNTGIDRNGGLAIDLGADGPTANDEDDTDTGANDLQNFPVLTELKCDPGDSFVDGTLNSAPNQTFTLQFFWVTSGADGSGHGEGEVYDGQADVTTDDEGNVAFRITVSSCLGNTLSATATNQATGDTSEFSANVSDF